MAPLTLAYVTPEVLRWARESTGYTAQEAARHIGIPWSTLEMVEAGAELLTLRQAEKAALTYDRTLATLFLPEPPAEEPQEVQFRRLPGAPAPPWKPEMQKLARKITNRQYAALDLHDALDDEPRWPAFTSRLRATRRQDLAKVAREILNVTYEDQLGWDRHDKYAAFRGWREAVEDLGVLVMQDGTLDVEKDMRGFASVEPSQLPAILINNGDDPRARAFTLLHEFGHLILAARGELATPETEIWCNAFAGEVLIPTDALAAALEGTALQDPLAHAEAVAQAFHVTPLAAAVRIAWSGLFADQDEADAAVRAIQTRWQGEDDRARGGSYYPNVVAAFGPGFLRLVFAAVDRQAVTLPTASQLLDGVKVGNFEKLRDQLEGRS